MPCVLWLRRDLRLRDHPALLAAADAGTATGGVAALFVLDDRLLTSAGAPRVAYLLASLRALDASLDGRLTVLRGRPSSVVPRFAHELEAPSVHISSDFTPGGRRRDGAVERALADVGVPLVRTGSPYAVAPGTLRTAAGSPYRVFSPFERGWVAHGWSEPARSRARPVAWVAPSSGRGVDSLPGAPDVGELRLPPAGEAAAHRRWTSFRDDRLGRYHELRDRPDLPGTSRLSPALTFGEIHPRTLLADLSPALADDRAAGARAYRGELAWREFYADVVFHRPESTRHSMRPVVPEEAWAQGPLEDDRLDAWKAGRTGYPLVDAGMRQLLAEGWVHNRVRMVAASFLVKDLHVRWQRGAEHFMRHLLDGDVSSNQQNWQWVAGTGTDAAPFFRIFNPVTQARTFDPEGDYVRRHVAELGGVPGRAVHEPWRLPGGPPPGYPERIVDHAVERQQALADHARRPPG